MARHYIESSEVAYTREDYFETVEALRDHLKAQGADAEEISRMERYYNDYKDQFCALYGFSLKAKGDEVGGNVVRLYFDEYEYHRPNIVSESDDVKDPTHQLVLKCDLGDGLDFHLSTFKAPSQKADMEDDEMPMMAGQIGFDDETVKNLNAEKLNRIFEFCHKYGFSTFGLTPAMNGDEIDIDASLADLLEKYNENQDKLSKEEAYTSTPKPSDDENVSEGMRAEDFHMIATPEVATKLEAGIAPSAEVLPETEHSLPSKAATSSKKKDLTVDDMAKNIRTFLRKDLHKRRGLSYWEHSRIIDGRQTYVFSIYPTEDPKNWDKDGKKKDDKYVATFTARLYVSQDKNGKFYFGYATPDGKPFDQTLANQFMGEIKKTGITHINLQNVPDCDKDTLMFAAAGRGIVPTGVKITSYKAKQILEKIGKLSAEEQAAFKARLANQMLKDFKGSPDSDEYKYIMSLRDQSGSDKKELVFKNFRDAFNSSTTNGLQNKMEQTAKTYGNSEIGSAWVCASGQTVKTIFDLYFNHFDETLGGRIASKIGKAGVDGISKEEALKLAPISSKKMKDMTTEDFALMYDVLLPRRVQISKENILDAFERKVQQGDTRAWHIVVQNTEWQRVDDELKSINTTLGAEDLKELKISFKKPLRFDVPEHLRPKKEKKSEEASKTPVTSPTAGRGSR
ncbi:MAG: hypothetical protein IJ870_04205 [Alphaproteobacteria bacterium]|nr:hypothetical protein [Alphaproteobacteria bacterium]